jgi:hypothetical protein
MTPQPQGNICPKCGDNLIDQKTYCANCGLAVGQGPDRVAIDSYVQAKVNQELSSRLKEQSNLVREIGDKAEDIVWARLKRYGWIITALIVIIGLWGIKTIDDAGKKIVESAGQRVEPLIKSTESRAKSVQDQFTKTADKVNTVKKSIDDLSLTVDGLKKTALQTKGEISQETSSLRNQIDTSRSQLQNAAKLAPEMASMRRQLTQATADIQKQQKVISSSEEFVKSVFSSHVVEFFNIGQPPENRYAVVPPTPPGNKTVVFLLLGSSPLPGTLQLQFHIYTQPPNSYTTIHNIVVFFWADAPDTLKTHQLSVSYFPDKSDQEITKSLSQHDGRVYADSKPLPNFN